MNFFVLSIALFALAQGGSASYFGKCPKAPQLAEPFDLNKYLGSWYGIASSNAIFEAGLRCVEVDYVLDDKTNNVLINNTGINFLGKPMTVIQTATPTAQANAFSLKVFSFTPSAQYWIVDTDYTSYSMIVSCNDILGGLFNFNDAWILSRTPTLDEDRLEALKQKHSQLGFTSGFTMCPQNC